MNKIIPLLLSIMLFPCTVYADIIDPIETTTNYLPYLAVALIAIVSILFIKKKK